METIYLLIPISVVLVFLIAIAFWWSLLNGKFDDMEVPAYAILTDDDRSPPAAPRADDHADPADVVDRRAGAGSGHLRDS